MNNTTLPKLLVVDDENSVINSIKLVLEYDFEIYSANNAPQALEILDKTDIHLMLLDIGLPGMTGLELLKQIKPVRPDIEVVLLTADTSADSQMEAMKLGAFDYVTKPFDIDHLMAVAKGALDKVNYIS